MVREVFPLEWLLRILTLLAVLAVAAYTWHYARWAKRRGLVRGAVGLVILGALAVLLPLWVMARYG